MRQPLPDMRFTCRYASVAGTVAVALLLSSCAHQYVEELAMVNHNAEQYGTPTEFSTASCRDALAEEKDSVGAELNGNNISVLNWNIQKERQKIWSEDFQSQAAEKDLVLMQEASLRFDTINGIDSSKHWSFAPGYTLDGEITGVMTLSKSRPLTQCSFVTLEPLLRTPKATSVTEYGLTGSEQTLVVVNVHAVNFSLGTGAFREQFEQILEVLREHDGPVILSGDFNTWRKRRIQIVEEIAAALELESVSFGEDKRVRKFGHVLDHLYVRGLSALHSDTEIVETSDHNPMSATFGR